jgi:outer membrane lipopolysaccharide assembly protein LptE/RlpB
MKSLKLTLLLVILPIVSSCGFKPILKNSDFNKLVVRSIEIKGNPKLKYFLESNINIEENKNLIDKNIVQISINDSASSKTKDSAGITTEEEIMINLNVTIINAKKEILFKDNFDDRKTVAITNNPSSDEEVKMIEKESIILSLIPKIYFALQAEAMQK